MDANFWTVKGDFEQVFFRYRKTCIWAPPLFERHL